MYQLPLEFALIPSGEFGYNETIGGPEYDRLFGAHHWLFANMGARTGLYYDGTHRRFTTASGVPTVVNTAGARDLDSLPLYLKPQRPEIDAAAFVPGFGLYYYALEILLDGIDLRAEITFRYLTRDPARNGVTISPGLFFLDQPSAARATVRAFVMLELRNDLAFDDEAIMVQVRASQASLSAPFAELFGITVTGANYINQSSYLAALHANGSRWAGLYGTGDAITTWDPDGVLSPLKASAAPNAPAASVDFIGARYTAADFAGNPERLDAISLDLVGSMQIYISLCLTQPAPANVVVCELFDPITTLPGAKISIAAGSILFEFWDTLGVLRTSTEPFPADGLPHDLLCYYDGAEVSLYLDGSRGGVTVAAGALTMRGANPMTFRAGADSGALSFFVGQLAGVQLYNEASFDVLRFLQYRKSSLGIANFADIIEV